MSRSEASAPRSPVIATRRQVIRTAALGAATLAGTRIGRSRAAAQEPATPPPRLGLSPQPDTATAWPDTDISFRGVDALTIGDVFVIGAESGAHSGIVVDHPDGRGCSFLVDDEFRPGELVTVSAGIPLTRSPDGNYRFRIVRPAPRASAETEFVTDEPEAGLDRMHHWVTEPGFLAPQLYVTDESEEASNGLILLTSAGPGAQAAAMIVDGRGEPVWYTTPAQPFYQLYCLKLQEYQGLPALTYAESAKTLGYGFGHWVILNQAYERVAHVQAGNGLPGLDVHDIVLTPSGSAWVIAYAGVNWERGAAGEGIVLDGVVQEIDIETGIVLFEWHSLDHIDVSESYRTPPDDPERAFDYIHLNSLAFDDDGDLLLSARHTHAAYNVSVRTGEVIWRLNGKQSDFEMGENTRFAFAHDVQRQADGTISLFDNHSDQQSDNGTIASRALFLDLDEERMTASVAREIMHPTRILSVSQANVQVLANGNVFMGWGSAPVFSEFSEDGELLFNGRFPPTMQSYRAYRHEWHAHPTERPVVVARRDGSGTIDIAVSWNGATDVATWRLLGGDDPDALDEIGRAERAGFETRFEIPSDADLVRVQALDANDEILGGSEFVTLLPE